MATTAGRVCACCTCCVWSHAHTCSNTHRVDQKNKRIKTLVAGLSPEDYLISQHPQMVKVRNARMLVLEYAGVSSLLCRSMEKAEEDREGMKSNTDCILISHNSHVRILLYLILALHTQDGCHTYDVLHYCKATNQGGWGLTALAILFSDFKNKT